MSPQARPLLEVVDLRVRFRTHDRVVDAVQGLDLDIHRGETVAVVGESGSGKTVAMLALLGLLPRRTADITAARAAMSTRDGDVDLLGGAAGIRGREIGYVAQDPLSALNPTSTIAAQMTDISRHHLGLSKKQARADAVELLGRVGVPDPRRRVDSYPHELSGGMRQRVLIAIAISCQPSLLIADEPTTALDVTVQAQIVDLVRALRDELGLAIIWITHDLGVVADLADRVAVMYSGRAVERAPVGEVFHQPLHPYTVGLLAAVPRLGRRHIRLTSIPGAPPDLTAEASDCAFAPRCPHAHDRCRTERPPSSSTGPDHHVACWYDLALGAPRP